MSGRHMLMLWINSDYSTHFWSTWRFKRFKTQWSEMLTADSVGGDVKSLVMLEMDGRTSRGEGWGDLNTKWWCLTDERCTTAVIYRHTHSVRVTRIFFFPVMQCCSGNMCFVTPLYRDSCSRPAKKKSWNLCLKSQDWFEAVIFGSS